MLLLYHTLDVSSIDLSASRISHGRPEPVDSTASMLCEVASSRVRAVPQMPGDAVQQARAWIENRSIAVVVAVVLFLSRNGLRLTTTATFQSNVLVILMEKPSKIYQSQVAKSCFCLRASLSIYTLYTKYNINYIFRLPLVKLRNPLSPLLTHTHIKDE